MEVATLKAMDSNHEQSEPFALTVEEAIQICDIPGEEESNICILETLELLSQAEALQKDIEELLQSWTLKDPPEQRPRTMSGQVCQANIEEDGETLVIGGFRFESAASSEDLRRSVPHTTG